MFPASDARNDREDGQAGRPAATGRHRTHLEVTATRAGRRMLEAEAASPDALEETQSKPRRDPDHT